MDGNLLNRGTSVVLYRQLAAVLRQHFCERHLLIGARIPTEFDLAAKYGVSRGTVREALGLLEEEGWIERLPGLGTFLRKEVDPLHSTGQRQIGLIIPHATDQLGLNILVGAESVAKYRGYQVVFNYSNENLEQEKADIRRMVQDQVAGLIIFPVSNQEYDEAIWDLHREQFPFVLIDRYFPDLDCDYVVADNFDGGYRAAKHLILLGCREVGFLYHPQADLRTTTMRDRYRGYRKALEEHHLDFHAGWLVPIDDCLSGAPEEDILQPYLEYLRQPDRPRAVITINDLTAISLVSAAARLGIKIPDDLAVVGFDNVKMSIHIQYPLTTIHQEFMELGVQAARLLLRRIDGQVGNPEHIVIPTRLVVRESCGARKTSPPAPLQN